MKLARLRRLPVAGMGRVLSNGLREPDETKQGYSGRDFVETLTGVKKSEGWEAGAGCEGGAHWAAKSANS
jgi:hypothetical protein